MCINVYILMDGRRAEQGSKFDFWQNVKHEARLTGSARTMQE
jgi:hypothetical protein